MTKKVCYVVSLVGSNVFHDSSTMCVIESLRQLALVRHMLFQKYATCFTEKATSLESFSGYWKYDNITDDRDISLVVTRQDLWIED